MTAAGGLTVDGLVFVQAEVARAVRLHRGRLGRGARGRRSPPSGNRCLGAPRIRRAGPILRRPARPSPARPQGHPSKPPGRAGSQLLRAEGVRSGRPAPGGLRPLVRHLRPRRPASGRPRARPPMPDHPLRPGSSREAGRCPRAVGALANRPRPPRGVRQCLVQDLGARRREAAPTWTIDDLRPFVGHAIGEFGADRIMFGSDWPVASQATSYGRWVAALDELTTTMSTPDRQRFWGDNARAFYRLGSPS